MNGFQYLQNYLDCEQQTELVHTINTGLKTAPFFTPTMPRTGKPFSVKMSNFGCLGWVSDKAAGYRYQAHHPETQKPWPAMPESLLNLWNEITNYPHPPEACLINFYTAKAKMGLHKDCDEEDFKAPVLSISLGDTALFRLGGKTRKDKAETFELKSGDIVVLGGESRLSYHGISRVKPDTSDLLKTHFPDGAGRINLTLRRVTLPQI